MKLNLNPGWKRGWASWAAGLIAIMAFAFCTLARIQRADRGSHPESTGTSTASVDSGAASASGNHFEVKNYFLDFAGDHSVNLATITEQAIAGYASYTVRLRLASGAEQSVVISAPPGGLRVEMEDMTGDHVPNDVILRPALLHWPPTVLVNDGHDHFAVVVSGRDPGCFSSGANLGSRRQDRQTFACLRSSGFKAVHLPHSKSLFVPYLPERVVSPFSQTLAKDLDRASSSGRAPPFFTTI